MLVSFCFKCLPLIERLIDNKLIFFNYFILGKRMTQHYVVPFRLQSLNVPAFTIKPRQEGPKDNPFTWPLGRVTST